MFNAITDAITLMKHRRPLVVNLTNQVTMDFMANALLATGATPIMTVCAQELDELVQLAHSINLNIGTLDSEFIQRINSAAQLARQYGKPVILDPVGAGASQIRTQTARELLPLVDIVRGNASEIMALANISHSTQGVESVNSTDEAKQAALTLACQHNITVVISGAVDFITDGQRQEEVHLGSALMPLVTGMGCTLTAVVAAFRALFSDSMTASLLATRYFTLCGMLAEQKSTLPGSFRTHFIDALYAPDFGLISNTSIKRS
ncbi:MAG: hydroxyethylthiazole kinase [Enterobacteriaceae bacterium]